MSTCHHCFKKATLVCGGCRAVPFCSQICQKQNQHRCIHNHYTKGDPIYADNIEYATLHNTQPVNLVYTPADGVGKRLQVGLSSIETEIPWETHQHLAQFIRVEAGYGHIDMVKNGKQHTFRLGPGEAIIVPSGYRHQIVKSKTSQKPLKLYSVYAKDSQDETWEH